MKRPLISVITPTLNNEKMFPEYIKSLNIQSYPEEKIEVIIVDGGSRDRTVEMARGQGFTIISNPKVLAEPGIAIGMKHAKGEILMVLAVDNIYRDKLAIEKIVKVFESKDIYAAFPRHDSLKKDSLYTKYVNTFTDPFNHFVYGYAANARTFKKIYKTEEHNSLYDVYDFSSAKTYPILALAQGFSVRRKFISSRKNDYDDLSPIIELIKKRKKIAYIHGLSLFHHTIRDTSHFFRKQQWATKNAVEKKNYGINARKNTLTRWQELKIFLYLPYSFSIVIPVIYALSKSIYDREKVWLFHPVINLICAAAIASEVVIIKLGLDRAISRS